MIRSWAGIATLVLAILKLTGHIAWSWFVVFLPLIITGLLYGLVTVWLWFEDA